VVVSYNSSDDLPRFFSALPAASGAGTDIQVVVADNASTDGSAELVHQLWPAAEVVRMPQNLGYAAGINAAVRAAEPSDAILVVNADTRLAPLCIDRLLAGLVDIDVGIAVPRLVDSNGDLRHSLRREARIATTLFETIFGGNRSGWLSRFGETIREPAAYRRSTQADWATGAAMMISRRCWNTTGPWDESFFLFAEETDYALRSRDAGFHLVLVPDAEAMHLEGQSHEDPRLWSMLVINRLRLFRRRNGRIRSAAFWLALVINEASRAAIGRRVHRAGLMALLFKSRRPPEVR
jgi:GT2 family glycosyltransferase